MATLALAAAFVAATSSVDAVKLQEKQQIVVSSTGVVIDASLPTGPYSASCQSCSMIPGTNSLVFSTLACQCYTGGGSLAAMSYLPNAWACNGCVDNIEGNLVCPLPQSSSNTNGYQSLCQGCGLNNGNLSCKTCNHVTPVVPYLLPNACSCTTVSFVSGELVCNSVTTSAPVVPPTDSPSDKPTHKPTRQPTQQPTTSTQTKSPTPNAAPTTCESYWLTLSASGEKAPYKPCSDGTLTNSNSCQYQNYCCWQPTSPTNPTTVGVCKLPNGVPVDCPILTQAACFQNSAYCSWNSSYGSSGLCQRRCPGNPQSMCALT